MKVKFVLLALIVLAIKETISEADKSINDNNEPPKNPMCPENENPENPTVLPYPGDCGKFYKCLYGRAYLIPCPPGLHWSSKLNRCDWPDVAKCDPNYRTTGKPMTTTSASIPVTTGDPTTLPPSTNVPPKHSSCPENENPEYPTVLPYPGDCSKFYKCLYGRAYLVPCPPGLHWSIELNRCDWPEVAKCDPNYRPTGKPITTTHSSNLKTTAITPTSIPTPTEVPPKHSSCPENEDPKNPTVLPYPGDCSKFYKCLHGRAYPVSCPVGLHWSIELNRCDWPEVAKCNSKSKASTTSQSKTEKQTNIPENSEKHKFVHKTENSGNGKTCDIHNKIRPHKNDCTKFIQCASGYEIELLCPIGTHFNAQLLICDYPQRAGCQKFALTENKNKINLPNNEKILKDKSKKERIPHKDCPKIDDPKNPVHLPHPSDCAKYYACEGGYAYEMKCPPGLHWSIKLKTCDWPSVAECDPNYTTPRYESSSTESLTEASTASSTESSTETPTEASTESSTESSTETSTETSTASSTKSSTEPSTESSTWASTKPTEPSGTKYCKNEKDDVYFPHPKDCSKYIHCSSGKDFIRQCPDGLYWNNKYKACDFPSNVDCRK